MEAPKLLRTINTSRLAGKALKATLKAESELSAGIAAWPARVVELKKLLTSPTRASDAAIQVPAAADLLLAHCLYRKLLTTARLHKRSLHACEVSSLEVRLEVFPIQLRSSTDRLRRFVEGLGIILYNERSQRDDLNTEAWLQAAVEYGF